MRILLCLAAVAACSDAPVDDSTYIAFGSSTRTVTVAWLPLDGATSVTIERGTSEDALAEIATLEDVESSSYLDTDVVPATTYFYRFTYNTPDGPIVQSVQHTGTSDDEPLVAEPVPTGTPITQTIGAAGGSIAAPNGATVIIPAGALPDGTQVEIVPITSPYADAEVPGLQVRADVALAKPIELVFPLDEVDTYAPENLTIAVHAEDGTWVTQPRTIDLATGTVRTTLAPTVTGRSRRSNAYGDVLFHAGILLRQIEIRPNGADLKVNQAVQLEPFGLFSDNPCRNRESVGLCIAITTGAVITRQLDLGNARRPAREFWAGLSNIDNSTDRTWRVNDVVNGRADLGFITWRSPHGVTYTAPPARPVGSMVVANGVVVKFNVVERENRIHRQEGAAVIHIKDPGSIRVTASFRIDGVGLACPPTSANFLDKVTFAITLDQNLEMHVGAINNGTTEMFNFFWVGGATGELTMAPEIVTMTGGTVTEMLGGLLHVKTAGTATGGSCNINTDNGPIPMTVGTLPPTFEFDIYPRDDGSLAVELFNTAIWQIEAEYIEG